jgi:hypothetical protein
VLELGRCDNRGVPVKLAAAALVLAFAAPAHAAAPVRMTLDGGSATPRVGAVWRYAVHATRAGKPVAGRITVQIVDPVGGVHPVDYANTKHPIANRRFVGVFRDFVRWPAETRGIPLKLRVTLHVLGVRRVLEVRVTPRR